MVLALLALICFVLSVLYGSQLLFVYTSLTDWFLELCRRVFTARYGLSPYIKQITFSL